MKKNISQLKEGSRQIMLSSEPFWEIKSFDEMTDEEWESLCDGCAKCCLFKIEDDDSKKISFTDIACRLLDINTCRCKVYEHRSEIVKDCIRLTPEKIYEINWLPESCSYRRLLEGRGLARWHPLISGYSDSVHQANVSILGKVVSETDIDLSEIEDRVVDWFD